MTGDDTDPQMVALALARGVERVTRRVDNLERLARQVAADATRQVTDVELLVQQLAAEVTALARVVGDPHEPDDDAADAVAGAVRSWLLAEDPDRARGDLADLVEWLAAVYLRYPGAALPSCWLWHPAVVEELWWLRHAHRAAYTGEGASWRDAGDWHDRQRPGVVKRVGAAVGDCELARHAGEAAWGGSGRGVPLAGAADRIAQTWTTTNTSPTPTDEQITEAETHDRAQHRNSR
jgi:hypothetical protein